RPMSSMAAQTLPPRFTTSTPFHGRSQHRGMVMPCRTTGFGPRVGYISPPRKAMEIVIERGRVIPFEALPDHSLALDGYVLGPAIDAERERYSFDHHGECVRHATRSTAEQVHDALALGLEPSTFTVYLNDVDLDTALPVWLLRHPE